jgi:hypothetical protein
MFAQQIFRLYQRGLLVLRLVQNDQNRGRYFQQVLPMRAALVSGRVDGNHVAVDRVKDTL